MVELNPIEQLVVSAMKDLGATKDTAVKTADDIMKKCNRPKGMVNNVLTELVQKGVIKRVAREKASGYFVVAQA
jgi:predicted transcriptional regulator